VDHLQIETKVRLLEDSVGDLCAMMTGIMAAQQRQEDGWARIGTKLRTIESGQLDQRVRVDLIEDRVSHIEADLTAKSAVQPTLNRLCSSD
jgi:hypothetical protein